MAKFREMTLTSKPSTFVHSHCTSSEPKKALGICNFSQTLSFTSRPESGSLNRLTMACMPEFLVKGTLATLGASTVVWGLVWWIPKYPVLQNKRIVKIFVNQHIINIIMLMTYFQSLLDLKLLMMLIRLSLKELDRENHLKWKYWSMSLRCNFFRQIADRKDRNSKVSFSF